MDSLKAYRFRVYPDAKRQKEINLRIILAQRLYNKILERVKEEYGKGGKPKVNMATLNKYMRESINEDKNFLKLYSQTRQEVFMRLIKAYANFFRRVKEKKQGKNIKVGFPRFKSQDRYYSIVYPQDNGSFSIEKERKTAMLRVSRIGRMKIDMYRQIEGTVKTLTIKKECGKYYAIFTATNSNNPTEVNDINPIGIDMGLNNFVALSDGKTIQKPTFFKQKEKKIARWQRIIARRKKGSKRRQTAKEKLQKEWNTVTNQSNDFMHKLSNKLVNEGYTSFAVESLNIQNMEKNHRLAQSIQNASWNRFVGMLSYKAESAGMGFVTVPAKNTTQECSGCGSVKKDKDKLTLEDRIYNCSICGLTMDRDVNASMNILKRGRAGLARTNAQGDICHYPSTGRASSVEELRTYSTISAEEALILQVGEEVT